MREKIIILLFVFISVYQWLNSITWHVKQDGTGDFTTIQEGIDAASNPDTVLAYPGTYFENIDFIGKHITVASLYLLTNDNSYIHSTIIDANSSGSGVCFISGENTSSIICGFTIQHGTGTEGGLDNWLIGGGIYVFDSSPKILSCLIQNNNARVGGGIGIYATWETGYSRPIVANCTIRYNHARWCGGGLLTGSRGSVIFSQTELCNIYFNTSGLANDIVSGGGSVHPMHAYIDTFTVQQPDDFFVYLNEDDTFTCQNWKVIPVNTDLYVNPTGDDNNSGISPDEPLQTITMALTKICSDSLHPNTIHLVDGIYSQSLTNEKYPINLRSFISIIGESRDFTILKNETTSMMMFGWNYEKYYTIKNFNFVNDEDLIEHSLEMVQPRSVRIENILIKDHHREPYGGSITTPTISSILLDSTSLFLKNVEIKENCGSVAGGFSYIEHFEGENIRINQNIPNTSIQPSGGGGIGVGGHYLHPDRFFYTFKNMEVTENINYNTDWPLSFSAICFSNMLTADLINCTIGNNYSIVGAAIAFSGFGADVTFTNSILYGDLPREVCFDSNYYESNNLTFRYSLLEGGIENIYNQGGFNYTFWEEGNIDTDPQWLGIGEFPYMLQSGSPCIDAGTIQLPHGIELPEYDIVGNPRIYGETIDMGAYEWQNPFASNQELLQLNYEYELNNYPNPFNPSTTISFNLPEERNVKLEIFNIKGQKVKTLMDAYSCKGHFELLWKGLDDNEKKVASGNYFAKLKVNGDIKAVRKLILLK